jgi:hypothetical protein
MGAPDGVKEKRVTFDVASNDLGSATWVAKQTTCRRAEEWGMRK